MNGVAARRNHYLPSGHLVYVASGTLRAIAFDPTRLETYASAVPVLSRLVTMDIGTADFAVATDGTLVYRACDVAGGISSRARLRKTSRVLSANLVRIVSFPKRVTEARLNEDQRTSSPLPS